MYYVDKVGVEGEIFVIIAGLILISISGFMIIYLYSKKHEEQREEAITFVVILVVLGILFVSIGGIDYNTYHNSYKIKIDDTITVSKLTDTFKVVDYRDEDNIWIVKQLDGNINPEDLPRNISTDYEKVVK